jgi:hypothetical protein
MTYETFTSAMQTLKDAKNHLRQQRGTGDCQTAIARNQAISLMSDAEFGLTGEFARRGQELDPLNPGHYKSQHIRDLERVRKDKKNAARRARHQAYTDCGMKRVRGALGGVYYE